MKRPHLTEPQISVLMLLWRRCRLTGRMMLNERCRVIAVPLWRRELVEIWWRQLPGESRGPYFSLTAAGYQLACALVAVRDERRRKVCVQDPPAAHRSLNQGEVHERPKI